MTTPLRHRRRAERFAQLLEEADGGRRQHRRTPLDDELANLVSLRRRLVASTPVPELDPEFRVGLRAMLMATAEREGIGATAAPQPVSPAPAPTPRRIPLARPVRAPRTRTAMIAGVAVGAVAFAGMSTASENAVPGDALYGVKRSTERAQLALASSDVGRGQLYLDFARTRVIEAWTLASEIERVLEDMDRDTLQGVRLLTTAATNRDDRAALDVVDDFTAEQRTALDELAGEVSGADRTRVLTSLELLEKIEERTADLRQTLGRDDCGGASAGDIDTLGPVPGACVAFPAPDALDLTPELTEHPAPPPQSQSGDGVVAEPTEPDRDAAETPAAEPADDAPAAEPASPADPAGEADPAPVEEDPQPIAADEEPATDDGGLLNGINRLLGNLLGG
jgi:hypothetical protein